MLLHCHERYVIIIKLPFFFLFVKENTKLIFPRLTKTNTCAAVRGKIEKGLADLSVLRYGIDKNSRPRSV